MSVTVKTASVSGGFGGCVRRVIQAEAGQRLVIASVVIGRRDEGRHLSESGQPLKAPNSLPLPQALPNRLSRGLLKL
jgi:hypothetical protein